MTKDAKDRNKQKTVKDNNNKIDVSVTLLEATEGPMFERYLEESTIENQSKNGSSFFDDDSSMDPF